MSSRRQRRAPSASPLGRGLELLAVLLVGAILVGSLLGQPVPVGYVETDSMRPQLAPGDGFVAIPAALTTVSVGDVVVFDATVVNGGRLTTHRVVDVTPAGYVTRGDYNRFTDQDGREPPVVDAQIVAEVVQVGGQVVPLPGLGTVAGAAQHLFAAVEQPAERFLGLELGGAQTFAVLAFVGGLGLYTVGNLRTPDRQRAPTPAGAGVSRQLPVRHLALAGLVLVVVSPFAMAAVASGPVQYDVVSADIDAPGTRVVPSGTSETGSHAVSAALLPTTVFLTAGSDALSVDTPSVFVPAGETRTVDFTVTAPAERGYYRYFLVEHRYPALLPGALLGWLHGLHPWAPSAALSLLAGTAYVLVALPFLRSRATTGSRRRRRRRG
jgi:signal peptidase